MTNLINQIDERIQEFDNTVKNKLMKIRGKLLHRIILSNLDVQILKNNFFIF